MSFPFSVIARSEATKQSSSSTRGVVGTLNSWIATDGCAALAMTIH